MNDDEIAEKHKLIGLNVALYRKAKGISQLDLSLQLGHKSISIIEHLLKISEILNVPIASFFEASGDEKFLQPPPLCVFPLG